MVLVACRECNKKISTEAKVCISCGAPNPTSKTKEIKDNLDPFVLIKDCYYKSIISLKDYCNKFINGKISLIISFWLIGFLGTALVALTIFFIIFIIFSSTNHTLVRFLALPWYIFITIGIWKSSDNYKGLKIWAILAKIFIIIWNLNNLLGIVMGNRY
jgi:hypothetical protein